MSDCCWIKQHLIAQVFLIELLQWIASREQESEGLRTSARLVNAETILLFLTRHPTRINRLRRLGQRANDIAILNPSCDAHQPAVPAILNPSCDAH